MYLYRITFFTALIMQVATTNAQSLLWPSDPSQGVEHSFIIAVNQANRIRQTRKIVPFSQERASTHRITS